MTFYDLMTDDDKSLKTVKWLSQLTDDDKSDGSVLKLRNDHKITFLILKSFVHFILHIKKEIS